MGHNLYLDLLYLPFTLLSISYVLDGIIIGGRFYVMADISLILSYFFGHGIASHFINETYSKRFTNKEIPAIKIVGYAALIISVILGLYALALLKWNPYLLAVGILEVFLLITYNHPATIYLHNDITVGIAVGALPALAGYIAATGYLTLVSFLLALICFLIVMLEITPSRFIKKWRRMSSEPERIVLKDGKEEPISLKDLVERPERVIKIMLAISYVMPLFLFFLQK